MFFLYVFTLKIITTEKLTDNGKIIDDKAVVM